MHGYSSFRCSYQNVDVTKKFHAKRMDVQMVVNNLSKIEYNVTLSMDDHLSCETTQRCPVKWELVDWERHGVLK